MAEMGNKTRSVLIYTYSFINGEDVLQNKKLLQTRNANDKKDEAE